LEGLGIEWRMVLKFNFKKWNATLWTVVNPAHEKNFWLQ
jgi:hypothetical protein